MKKYKAIIYDIDGTLLDTLKMNLMPLIQIIEEETGKKISYEESLKYYAAPGMQTLQDLKIKDPKKTYARWVKYVNEYPGGAQIYDGIETMLQTFEHQLVQAIVSSKLEDQYQIDMVKNNLDHYFDVVVLADDTKKHKPDPEPLNLCLEKLAMKPDEVIFIGDSDSDYLAAKNAGIDFGYALWGRVLKDDLHEAAYVFEHPLDVLKLLD